MDKQPKRILLDISEVYRQVVPELHRLRLLSVDLRVVFSNVFDAIVEKESVAEGIKAIQELTYQQMEPVMDDAESKNPRVYGFLYADLEILFLIIRMIAWNLEKYLESWRLYDNQNDRCDFRIVKWFQGDTVLLEEGTNFELNPRADFDCGVYPFHSILSESLESTTIEDILTSRIKDRPAGSHITSGLYLGSPIPKDSMMEHRPDSLLVEADASSRRAFLGSIMLSVSDGEIPY